MSEATIPAPAPAMPRGARSPRTALTLSVRCVRLSSRNVEALLTSLMLPIVLMLLFVYLFGGAIQTGSSAYVTYVVPGVILLCAGFGAAQTAVSVSQDMGGGIVDRLRAMDIGGGAILTGHVVASVARNIASTVLVFGVAFAIGFRPDAGVMDWLAAAGLVLAYVLALSWFSAALGLLASSPEAANGFTFLLMFLPYASSAFVPVDTMPGWIQPFAAHQPITPITESVRGLLLGGPLGTDPWQALSWSAGILAVSVALTSAAFRRHTR